MGPEGQGDSAVPAEAVKAGVWMDGVSVNFSMMESTAKELFM